MKTIVWADDVTRKDIPLVGGKGANLGEMLKHDFPVPGAFIITADAFWQFLKESGIKSKLFKILSSVDVNDDADLKKKSKEVRKLVEEAKMPWDMEIDIINAYKKISHEGGVEEEFVAVRSSATAEDLPEASFAGQQETYLNVHTEADLLRTVKLCWSSLYTPRAIFYREKHGFEHEKVGIAVAVQKMVNSEVSGVMFTSDPVTGEPKVIIETGYGLGEAIVGGQITPDTYSVDQKTLRILDKKISTQTWKYTRDKSGNTVKVDVEPELQDKQKLSDELIVELAGIGKRIEEHYKEPQDVEWCLEANKLYIVQSRPVTTIKRKPKAEAEAEAEAKAEVAPAGTATAIAEETPYTGKILLKGLPASPGIGTGTVTLVSSLEELDKVHEGNILVTVMTSPDMVPAMKRASAIVTDEGGTTCHAAIVSRELGIPCIVGTGNATETLSDGMGITVDATVGVVYEGIRAEAAAPAVAPIMERVEGVGVAEVPVTATKIYINLGVPEAAEKHAKLPAQGVGLMREEFVAATYIKIHPNVLIDYEDLKREGKHPDLIKKIDELTKGYDHKPQYFIDKLAEGIAMVARAFNPRPVVLRTSDFKTNEYHDLIGGELYEPEEANPMIGWRGCSRYVSLDFEEAFRLELRAIRKVREEMGLRNVWVMLPFVRTLEETKKIIEIMKEEGLERSRDFKLWIMAELPCNIFMADKYAELVDGFSIGSNDLTQLIMGADRDSEILGRMGYFDERNEAVTRAIKHLIEVAHAKGCTVSICGQAPSVYPEFTEFLVRAGIDSISLNPDTVMDTIRLVGSIEQKVMMERLRAFREAEGQ